MSGKNNAFYGKHHTEQTKRKISEKNIGRTVSIDIRDRISSTLKRKYKTGEKVHVPTKNARKLASERWKKNNPSKSPIRKKHLSKLMLDETNPSTKWWIFENKSGDKFERFSFRRTCKELNLSYGTMRKWIGKNGFNRQGWKVYERNM